MEWLTLMEARRIACPEPFLSGRSCHYIPKEPWTCVGRLAVHDHPQSQGRLEGKPDDDVQYCILNCVMRWWRKTYLALLLRRLKLHRRLASWRAAIFLVVYC